MLPHARRRAGRRSSCSQTCSAPSDGCGLEALALGDELAGPADELVAGHGAGHPSPRIIASRSARARRVHGPGRAVADRLRHRTG